MVKTLDILSEELENVSDAVAFAMKGEDAIRKYTPGKSEGIGISAYCKEVPCQCITVKCY